ncbi:hypothetical protein L873DRAFT_1476138 [Choiromyces venosus 120613-1]|uniref:Uncharacterized protein n=1 Tax=Choiromyces venosus 120613-1 TaxID=1336337 RepID=A0A3N4JCK5_9PEZI|nr:hypothetical protein L873DRAFT_1476138 [Choiromyces venosus 120613-1]
MRVCDCEQEKKKDRFGLTRTCNQTRGSQGLDRGLPQSQKSHLLGRIRILLLPQQPAPVVLAHVRGISMERALFLEKHKSKKSTKTEQLFLVQPILNPSSFSTAQHRYFSQKSTTITTTVLYSCNTVLATATHPPARTAQLRKDVNQLLSGSCLVRQPQKEKEKKKKKRKKKKSWGGRDRLAEKMQILRSLFLAYRLDLVYPLDRPSFAPLSSFYSLSLAKEV